MDCGVIRKDEGTRREERMPEDSVNEPDNGIKSGVCRLVERYTCTAPD